MYRQRELFSDMESETGSSDEETTISGSIVHEGKSRMRRSASLDTDLDSFRIRNRSNSTQSYFKVSCWEFLSSPRACRLSGAELRITEIN